MFGLCGGAIRVTRRTRSGGTLLGIATVGEIIAASWVGVGMEIVGDLTFLPNSVNIGTKRKIKKIIKCCILILVKNFICKRSEPHLCIAELQLRAVCKILHEHGYTSYRS